MATSQFLRSVCCDAPVRLDYDPTHGEFPVRCRRCGETLGVPDTAALAADTRAELRWRHAMMAFQIRYLYGFASGALGLPSSFVRITSC